MVFPPKTSTSAYPRDPDPVGASEGFLRLVNLLVQQILDKSWMLDLLIGMVSFSVFLRCFFSFSTCGGFHHAKVPNPTLGTTFCSTRKNYWIIPPNYIGNIRSHYVNPYKPTSMMESNKGFFRGSSVVAPFSCFALNG